MVVKQLIDDAKSLIGPACEVSETIILAWINDYLQDIYSRLKEADPSWFSKKVDTSSIATQVEYALPIDFESMLALWFSPQSDGNFTKCYPLDRYGSSHSVAFTYYLRAKTFGFGVPPTKNGNHNIRLVYSHSLPDLNIENPKDEPDLPLSLQRKIKHGVYSNYLAQDDKQAASISRFQLYDELVDQEISRLVQRNNDQGLAVEDTSN